MWKWAILAIKEIMPNMSDESKNKAFWCSLPELPVNKRNLRKIRSLGEKEDRRGA